MKKMKKWLSIVLAAVMVTVLFTACSTDSGSGSGNPSGGDSGKKPVIGVSLMTLQYPFFQDIKSGIEEAAGGKYEIKFNDANLDLQAQIDAIENYVAQGVSAIILNAVDPDGIITALESAAAKNIPVITVDMKPNGGVYATYIGSDNHLGGELAAVYASKFLLQGKANPNIVLLKNPLSTASTERIDGFKSKMQELIPGAVFVAEKGADTREKFMSAMEDILVANKQIDLVFSYSAQGGLGANDAIQAAQRSNEIAILGFDASDEEQTEIAKDSSYKGSVIQFPDQLGKTCVESVSKILAGETLDKDIPVDVGIFTKDKIYSVEDLK